MSDFPVINRNALRVPRVIATLPGLASFAAWLSRTLPSNRLLNSFVYRVAEANSAPPGAPPRIATLIGGAKLVVSFDENLFRQAYFFGSHEPDLSRLLLQIAKPGQTWLDIGANIGVFTVTLAKCVQSSGRVIAFEPNKKFANRLRESIHTNGFTNVDLRRKALGSVAGEATLNVPLDPEQTPGGSGRASLLKQKSLGEVVIERVEVSTLDMEMVDIGSVYGVKMDVEGFEAAVLKGGKKFFSERPPKVIVFEVTLLPEALASPEELLFQIQAYGYDLFSLPSLAAIKAEKKYEGGFCENVLGVQRGERNIYELLGMDLIDKE